MKKANMIKIQENDAAYLWNLVKSNPRADNNDEQFFDDEGTYYNEYDHDGIVIRALFTIIDANAPMDTNDFCDWDNPIGLYVLTDKFPA